MEQELRLPRQLAARHWKVRVYANERLEPPHATVLWKYKEWRINLRDGTLMSGKQWGPIDDEVWKVVESNWELLKTTWNFFHPRNPA